MTLAAAELNVTPGAVSRQVRELEKELETVLFVRTNVGLDLTESGEALAATAAKSLDMLAAANASLRRHHARRLRIGAFGFFVSRAVFPMLPAIRQELPELELEFHTSNSPLDLVPRSFDAVIAVGDGKPQAGVISEPLMAIETVPVCSPDLLEDAIDFAEVPLLHARPRPDDWRRWLDHAGLTGVPATNGSSYESIGLAIEAASRGLGAAIAIDGLLAPDLDSDAVVVAHELRRPTRRCFVLQIETKRKHDPELRECFDWLVERFGGLR